MEQGPPPGATDLVVVGAGIVGLAAARELLRRRPGLRVTVLEREDDIGRHQTGSSSGVVHAGIYYRPGSLKARLCVEGARELHAFCEERTIPHERCGKVIVALDRSELAGLDELERRGRANGVTGLRRLDAAGLREVEPHAAGIAALHSAATGIVDFRAVAQALAADLRAAGATVVLGCAAQRLRREGGRVDVHHRHGELRARAALVCAGAWTDRLAERSGGAADPRVVPFRGRYLRLRPEARHLVRALVYPVPDPALPFLGVHLTRTVDGEVLLGPSALLLPRPRSLAWPGTWRVMRRFWRSGARELRLATSRRAFAAACARYVPELAAADVLPGPHGDRAQAVGRDGELVDDFVLEDEQGALFVRNAPSPAATSSLAIARLIADRAGPLLQ